MGVCSLNGSKRKVHTIPTLPPIPLLLLPALAAPLTQRAYIKADLEQHTYVLTCSFSCLCTEMLQVDSFWQERIFFLLIPEVLSTSFFLLTYDVHLFQS